jgi:hypothetical protein
MVTTDAIAPRTDTNLLPKSVVDIFFLYFSSTNACPNAHSIDSDIGMAPEILYSSMAETIFFK